jgi:phosphate transport system substrate-binding protein
LVDDSFQPLIEDQVAVFESKYKDITVQGKSENELIQPFLTSRIVVLSRMLSSNEAKYFEQLKIKPKLLQ